MAFPAVVLLDSFKREENPLSNGGKWKTWAYTTGSIGHCVGIDWENGSASDIESAYWSPEEFTPATEPVGVAITRDRRITDTGTWFVWACLTHPTEAGKFTGYVAKIKFESENKFEATLYRCDEGPSFHKLGFTETGEVWAEGDRLGLAVIPSGGSQEIGLWHKIGAEEWKVVTSELDNTYTKGFIAFGIDHSANGDTTNFEGPKGEAPPEGHKNITQLIIG